MTPVTLCRREITALQNLDHPNIIRMMAHSCSPGGEGIRIVFELAPHNLEERIFQHGAAEALPVDRWMCGLLSGLAHMHAAGMVHRVSCACV